MEYEAANPVTTSIKTIKILETIWQLEEPTLMKIDENLELSKSTIHNHLQTLRQCQYIVEDAGEYRLSLNFLSLGGSVRNEINLFKEGKSRIDTLASETGQLANLLTEEYGRGIYLYRSSGEQSVDIDTYAGKQTTMHDAALGKAILAEYPRERVQRILDTHGMPQKTDKTITSKEELFDELETIQEQGYALDDEERALGVRCIAAPVIDPNDNVAGAASVSFPASRLDNKKDKIVNEVQSTANIIELSLKYE